MTWIKWVVCYMFIMLFIFKDLTIIGEILRQGIKSLSSVYPPHGLLDRHYVQSVWGTIWIKILWVHRFYKFGLGIWPSSFSAHKQWNWKESKGQRDLYVTQEEKMEDLNFSYLVMLVSQAYSSIPHCLLLLLFVILPTKRNYRGVKWCQHFPFLFCCAF